MVLAVVTPRVEPTLVMVRKLAAVTDTDPDSQILAARESTAVRLGRKLTRIALESALQRQAQAAEKNEIAQGDQPLSAMSETWHLQSNTKLKYARPL